MPNPITDIPLVPLQIDDDINASAEAFVANLLQLFAAGSVGTTNPYHAPEATVYPTGPDKPPASTLLTTRAQQLFFRQLGVAIAKTWTLQSGNSGPGTNTTTQFVGECLPEMQVGDLVYVYEQGRVVRRANPHDFMMMPSVGAIIQKPMPTTAVVQTNGLVQGVYENLQPGTTYFVGKDSRPCLPPDLLPNNTGEQIFYQPIGVAIDMTIMLMSPSMNLTRK